MNDSDQVLNKTENSFENRKFKASKTKIIKENIAPNMVLVKKNNFYFFDKGVQMKSKTKENLIERCFSQTLNNKNKAEVSEIQPSKRVNSLESEILNLSSIIKKNEEKQFDHFKMKNNQRDNNKFFDFVETTKQSQPIKSRSRKIGQLVFIILKNFNTLSSRIN